MSGPIVYIDHSEIREGRIDEVKAAANDLTEFVDTHEPQLTSYGFYLDEADDRLTLIATHPDSASLEYHMEVAGPIFRRFTELIDLISIDVYGRPSPSVLDALHHKAQMLGKSGRVAVHDLHAGFTRFTSMAR